MVPEGKKGRKLKNCTDDEFTTNSSRIIYFIITCSYLSVRKRTADIILSTSWNFSVGSIAGYVKNKEVLSHCNIPILFLVCKIKIEYTIDFTCLLRITILKHGKSSWGTKPNPRVLFNKEPVRKLPSLLKDSSSTDCDQHSLVHDI